MYKYLIVYLTMENPLRIIKAERERQTSGVLNMFKVIESNETISHDSGNPELETETTVFTVLLDGVAVGVSFGTDESDQIIADIVSENPELAHLI